MRKMIPEEARKRRRRTLAQLAVVAAGCFVFTLVYLPGARGARSSSSSEGARRELENTEPTSVAQDQGASGGSSEFLHTNPNHARLPCLLCHKREDNSPRPRLPGHIPCSGCHVPEFQSAQAPLCMICHEGTVGGSLKAFPPLRSFLMRFDHALHTRGAAAAGCATCHRPARVGVAQSIPGSAGAHSTCFQCHTARAQGPSGREVPSGRWPAADARDGRRLPGRLQSRGARAPWAHLHELPYGEGGRGTGATGRLTAPAHAPRDGARAVLRDLSQRQAGVRDRELHELHPMSQGEQLRLLRGEPCGKSNRRGVI
jgi:cytochrome c553